jgi:N-methylhydantoinase B
VDGPDSLDDLPQYANVDLPPGRLLIEGPGGGGFGDPLARPADLVAADVRDGVVSVESAKKDYGVVVGSETFEIDEEGTEEARGK